MNTNFKYRIKNGKKYYYAVYKDAYGKRHEENSPTPEGLQAKMELRNKMLSLSINIPNQKFEDYLENYLYKVHFLKLKPKSKQRYKTAFESKLKGSPLGQMKMNKLTIDAVQYFYNELFAKTDSSNQVKEVHKIINPCLRYAYRKGDILRNFDKMLLIPEDSPEKRQAKIAKNSVKPLTREEHIQFVKAIKGHPLEALFRTAIDTGARQGELFALTWEDIDFDKHIIIINKSYSYSSNGEGLYSSHTGPTKCNETRKNKLSNSLTEVLKQHKINQKVILSEYGVEQVPSTLVFCTPIGTHLDSSNVLKKLKEVFLELGINKPGNKNNKVFHDLRHTFATRQFEQGVEPLVISKLLGHSDINTTLKTYIHIMGHLKDATADLTDEFYASMGL